TDVTVGLFWSLGMALGVLMIALTPGYPPNVESYLFGNILTVSSADLIMMVVATAILLFAVVIYYHYWIAYLFDDEFSTLIGIRSKAFEYVLFALIAIAVVATIKVVGIILVIALFTAPTATASLFTRRMKTRMIAAVLMSMVYTLIGLFLSYTYNLAAGATIVVLAVMTYVILALTRSLYRHLTAH
ncbi:MAG: metal ABC transporter permease, partial [Acholeplasmataceae bacterium]